MELFKGLKLLLHLSLSFVFIFGNTCLDFFLDITKIFFISLYNFVDDKLNLI